MERLANMTPSSSSMSKLDKEMPSTTLHVIAKARDANKVLDTLHRRRLKMGAMDLKQ